MSQATWFKVLDVITFIPVRVNSVGFVRRRVKAMVRLRASFRAYG